jgi:hypothetical protein
MCTGTGFTASQYDPTRAARWSSLNTSLIRRTTQTTAHLWQTSRYAVTKPSQHNANCWKCQLSLRYFGVVSVRMASLTAWQGRAPCVLIAFQTSGPKDLPLNVRTLSVCVNPLKTKRRPLYLKSQSVPRCKHFSKQKKKPISLCCKWHMSLFVLR